jgi:hypothetical protein
MPIRKSSALARLYQNERHVIDESYAELRLLRAACAGDTATVLALFTECKLFGGAPCVIDTPYRRYEGLAGVRAFVAEWLTVFRAQAAEVVPVIQTRANGRSVTEMQVRFTVDGAWEEVPFFVVGDLRTQTTLEEVRIYTHCSFVPGLEAYRKPMFPSAHLEMGDPGLLTGAVREYYSALHHVPRANVDRIMACTADNCLFGGYEPDDDAHRPVLTRTELRAKYEMMANYIPRCVGMRYETIIDDGRTCVIEWVHIVSRAGREERGRIALSGIAAYERDEEGLLCSIRICDYANLERTIDWAKLPFTKEEAQSINFVETFPPGVGRKAQD